MLSLNEEDIASALNHFYHADKAYDSKEIRGYNRNNGIISNTPVNKRNRKNPKIGWQCRLNNEDYSERSAIERFFSWIGLLERFIQGMNG